MQVQLSAIPTFLPLSFLLTLKVGPGNKIEQPTVFHQNSLLLSTKNVLF